MFNRFTYALGGLLPHRLSPQVRALYWASTLQGLAMAMLLLFEPIYLWQQGFGIKGVLVFFLGVYIFYLFLMPLGAQFATRHGYEHSMVVSTVIQVTYYATLFLIEQSWWFALPAAALYALQKTFYWPAYHADFVRYSDKNEEGRQVSSLTIISTLVYIVGPLLAGWLITVGSWWLLFAFGSTLMLLSAWPLLSVPEIFTPREFSYPEAFKRLFAVESRKRLFSYFGFGEELIALVVWPIFIYTVIIGYVEIGALVAGATLITALVTLYIGKITDDNKKVTTLRLSTIFYSLGWVARLFFMLPFQVFLIDSWSRTGKNMVVVPLTAITYDQAREHSVMDIVIFYEMSLVVGKILAIVILLFILSLVNVSLAWNISWIVAGAMTLFYLLHA